jgi:hypothetical protein
MYKSPRAMQVISIVWLVHSPIHPNSSQKPSSKTPLPRNYKGEFMEFVEFVEFMESVEFVEFQVILPYYCVTAVPGVTQSSSFSNLRLKLATRLHLCSGQ